MSEDMRSFAESIYTIIVSFVDLKSVEALENYWLSNTDAINIIKNTDNDLYLKLISKFKEQKDAINSTAHRETKSLDDKSLERARKTKTRLESKRGQGRGGRYTEHHPNAGFWKKPRID